MFPSNRDREPPELRIHFDKAQRRIEVSATVSEAVAKTLDNTKGLPKEALVLVGGGLAVTASDIAGAGFEPATFGL